MWHHATLLEVAETHEDLPGPTESGSPLGVERNTCGPQTCTPSRTLVSRANHILVVDDDADFREMLREVLMDEGCTVSEAANGKDALEMLGELTPDLILVDLMMPVMNGWDLFAALQCDARLSSVPVAVLSAVARMRPMGSRRNLSKPIDLPNLLGLLDTIDTPDVARH